MGYKTQLKKYYRLAKPGIVYGNLFTAAAGFLLASRHSFSFFTLLATLVGIGLVIGGSCVLNNYLDRDIDAKMERTKNRALAAGTIPVLNAMYYAMTMLITGFVVLGLFTNSLTLLLGFLGVVFYVVVYGVAKRTTIHSTVIGSISGAIPPVAGYTAVTGHLDSAALILFLTLTLWQMPHFYSIGIYRHSDYKNAGLPVLPVKKGFYAAKVQITLYLVGFIISALCLNFFGYANVLYLLAVLVTGFYWLRLDLIGYKARDNIAWAKKMFGVSLITIVVLSLGLYLTPWLPATKF